VLWVLYALSLLFVWFENKFIVRPRYDRPLVFSNRAILWLLRLALTYGTLAGIWFVHGLWTAVIGLSAFYVFNKLTFAYYFSKMVQVTSARCFRTRLEEASNKHEQIDESRMGLESHELAKCIVMSNVKGEGF
jgi:hypothetical protein